MGYSSSIKVQVGNICSDDCTSIPWDEFQVFDLSYKNLCFILNVFIIMQFINILKILITQKQIGEINQLHICTKELLTT